MHEKRYKKVSRSHNMTKKYVSKAAINSLSNIICIILIKSYFQSFIFHNCMVIPRKKGENNLMIKHPYPHESYLIKIYHPSRNLALIFYCKLNSNFTLKPQLNLHTSTSGFNFKYELQLHLQT